MNLFKKLYLSLLLLLSFGCMTHSKYSQEIVNESINRDSLAFPLDSSWEQIEGTSVRIKKNIFDSSVFTKTDSLVAGRIYVDDVTGKISYSTGGRFDWFLQLTYKDYSDVPQLAKIGYWPTFPRSDEKESFEEKTDGKGRLVYASIVHGKHFLEYRCTLPVEKSSSHDYLAVFLYKVYVYHNKVVRIQYHRIQHKDSVSYKEHDYVLSCIKINLN